jgi:hypothetical protein
MAKRPRIHELAYSLAFMFRTVSTDQKPENFAWERVPQLIEDYEATSNSRLTFAERAALAPYAAAVPLYAAALDGFTEDPVGKLLSRAPFLQLSEWLLSHPKSLLG